MNFLTASLPSLHNLFFQSFLPSVCVRTQPSQAECLNPAPFSLAQQAKKWSQTIRSGSKKKFSMNCREENKSKKVNVFPGQKNTVRIMCSKSYPDTEAIFSYFCYSFLLPLPSRVLCFALQGNMTQF